MPLHWDWDLDWHHDHLWHWPRSWTWSLDSPLSYHLKCPTRRRFWGFSATDFDVCDRDAHLHYVEEPWCHRSCLVSKVGIETGEEANTSGKGTFKVIIDVHHFRPDELCVKVRNSDLVVIEGRQKDDRADKGVLCITREFTRKYKLPRNYDATLARATISTDGILSVVVPPPAPLDDVEREVEILPTGTFFGSTTSPPKDKKAIEAGGSGGGGGAAKGAKPKGESEEK